MSGPAIASIGLLVTAIAASITALALSDSVRRVCRRDWPVIALFMVLGFLVRYPFDAPFYHGTEYEDCYVHQAAARQLGSRTGFRESIYSFGSLDDGDAEQTFYNYIGYPIAIWLVQQVTGDSPAAGHIVSLASSCLSVLLVYLLASRLTEMRGFAILATLVYVSLPLANSQAATTSTEVLSSLLVLLVVLLADILARDETRIPCKVTLCLALATVLTVAVLVRRDGLLLVVLFPLVYVLAGRISPHRRASGLAKPLLIAVNLAVVPLVFSFAFLGLHEAYLDEYAAVGSRVFSVENLLVMGPAFAKSFLQPRWYLLFGAALLLAPVAWLRLPRLRPAAAVVVAYLSLYAVHDRGYYVARSGYADPSYAIRFTMNVMPLLAVLAAGGMLAAAPARLRKPGPHSSACRTAAMLAAIVVLVVGAMTSTHLRQELTEEEQTLRIVPTRKAIAAVDAEAGQHGWLFTFEPCVAQIYGPRRLKIVDAASVGRLDNSRLESLLSADGAHAFLRAFDLAPENLTRYEKELSWLLNRLEGLVAEGKDWQLFRLRRASGSGDSASLKLRVTADLSAHTGSFGPMPISRRPVCLSCGYRRWRRKCP